MLGRAKKLKVIRGTLIGDRAAFVESGDAVLTVDFNPGEYSIDESNSFSEAAIPGLEAPLLQFSHGSGRTLSMDLLLDTYTYRQQKDIRTHLATIQAFLAIDGSLHAPPPCKVVWGSLEFIGLLQSARTRFVLFLDDGTPVRARVSLTWKEYLPVEMQIKERPRASPDRRRIRVFREGDSLWRIAHEAYGRADLWRFVAAANDLEDPLRIRAGHRLVLPPLENLQAED